MDVVCEDTLKQYVDFCLDKDIGHHIQHETSRHHILPKAKLLFPQYSNLSEFSWNGVYLKHEDHYMAHYLLDKATNNFSINKAFIGMHEKDLNLHNIEDILISADEYNKARLKHSVLMSNWQNEIMSDGRKRAQHNADKMVETKRKNGYYESDTGWQLNTPEAIDKQKETLRKINPETGLTKSQEIGKKVSKTLMNKPSVTCPHCGLNGRKGSNMTRYHFDNCPVNKGMSKEDYWKNKNKGNLHKV